MTRALLQPDDLRDLVAEQVGATGGLLGCRHPRRQRRHLTDEIPALQSDVDESTSA
jgi:hypothetical protein